MHRQNIFYTQARFTAIIFGFLFMSTGCEPLPKADFYELEGIVSIPLHQLSEYTGWEKMQTSTSVSLVPSGNADPAELTVEFSANSGSYTLWILSRALRHESDNLLFRIENIEGDLVAGGRAAVPFGLSREWMSSEYTTGDLLTFRLPERRLYRLTITVAESDDILVDKLHLTRNNEYPPSGFGYPATVDPNGDPVWERRDLKPHLPPVEMFGVVDLLPEPHDFPESDGESRSADFTKISDLYSCKYVDNPLKKITPADLSINPDTLTGSAWLETVVEAVANQRLDVYDAPYLTGDLEGIAFTEEEWIRWVQFSAFNSIMYVPPEVAPELSDRGKQVVEFYKNMREELFPYIYGAARDARMNGLKPVIGDPFNTDQFMLGKTLLVAPILDSNPVQQIHLPQGRWFDYWSGAVHPGGGVIEVPLDPARIPLFVKAGSVIPYSRKENGDERLEFEIYGGGEGAGTFWLYEDDGVSTIYLQGEFSTVSFRYFEHDTHGALTIGKRVRGYPGQPDRYQMTLRFKHIPEPVTIKANGETLEDSVWTYNNDSGELVLEWEQMADQKTDLEVVWVEGSHSS